MIDPGTAALIAQGVGSAIGISGGAKADKAAKNMQKNQNIYFRQNRQSAYQDTVKDMKKAGLNPMMLASGSSLSTGAMPAAPDVGNTGRAITAAGENAAQGLMLKAQLKNMNSSTNLNEEMKNKAIQDAALLHTQTYTEGEKAAGLSIENEFKRATAEAQLNLLVKNGALSEANRDSILADMGLNKQRGDLMVAQGASANAAAAATRAGMPGIEWENSGLGIASKEGQSWVKTLAGAFADMKGLPTRMPTPAEAKKEGDMYRRTQGYQPTSRGEKGQKTY